MIKTISKKNKFKKAKCLSKEALQIAEKRREAKSKGEKDIHPGGQPAQPCPPGDWRSSSELSIPQEHRRGGLASLLL